MTVDPSKLILIDEEPPQPPPSRFDPSKIRLVSDIEAISHRTFNAPTAPVRSATAPVAPGGSALVERELAAADAAGRLSEQQREQFQQAEARYQYARSAAGGDVGKQNLARESYRTELGQLGITSLEEVPLPTAIGRIVAPPVERGGKVIAATIADIGEIIAGGTPTNLRSFAAAPDQPLPVEHEIGQMENFWPRLHAKAGLAVSRVIPMAGGSSALARLGVNPAVANAAVLGFNPDGSPNPIGLAAGLGLPIVDATGRRLAADFIEQRLTQGVLQTMEMAENPRQLAELLLKRHPQLSRESVRAAVEGASGQLANNLFLGVLSTPEIITSDNPREAIENAVINNLALSVLGARELFQPSQARLSGRLTVNQAPRTAAAVEAATKGVEDAIQKRETAPVLPTVPAQPVQGAREMPAEEGAGGVRGGESAPGVAPGPQGAAQPEVTAREPTPLAPTPEPVPVPPATAAGEVTLPAAEAPAAEPSAPQVTPETPSLELANVADSVYALLQRGDKVEKTFIHELGKRANLDPKQAEEEAETALVRVAREIAQSSGPVLEKYRKIVDLYNRAPNLTTRTVESKVGQAYSTPPPLAFLADNLADLRGGARLGEPTAGHGMLVIDAAPNAQMVLNELDEGRRRRLSTLFSGRNTGIWKFDATTDEFLSSLDQFQPDRLIMNPPFGSRLGKGGKGEQFPLRGATTAKLTTPSIDIAIALNSLESMAPGGKAALILGAKTGSPSAQFGSDESRAEAYRRPEFLQLFQKYNVTDWFTVSGELYDKMGAGWPVDVVIIDGKKPTAPSAEGGMIRPWVTPPRVYSSWDELESKLREPGAITGGTGGSGGGVLPPQSTGGQPRPGTSQAGPPRPAGAVGTGGLAPAARPAGPEQAVPRTTGQLPSTGGGTGDVRASPGVVSQPPITQESGPPDVAGTGPAIVPAREPQQIGGLNGPYRSVSRNADPKLIAPANIADAMTEAVRDVEKQTGKTIDDYVSSRLGWTKEQLYERLNAAQIDSVGLAIRNIERGSALISGDQMGVGKGRQVASIIEYARKQGLIPVFITAKAQLYEDMAGRDLPAVGNNDFKPFITDTEYAYIDGQGKEISSKESKRAELEVIATSGELPVGYDGLFTTYDQLKSDRPIGFSESAKGKFQRKKARQAKPDGPRLAALRALAPRSIFILDESHIAAGADSDLFLSLQTILPATHGAFFASATFAKRPDNMGLYATKTLMARAIDNLKSFVEMMEKGGNPLQQALSAMLTKSGEFVRREQDWSAVNEFRFEKASNDPQAEVEAADTYTSFLRDLMQLAAQVNAAAKKVEKVENQVRAEETQVKLEPMTFGSRLFNLSQQYLLALRADAIASKAITELRGGRKPFIALYNTMAGPISELHQMGLPLNFGGILQREMRKMLRVTIRDPMAEGGKTYQQLEPEQLADDGAFFHRLEQQIVDTDFGAFPISPLDHIKRRIVEAGYTVGEITARDAEVTEEGGEVKVSKREKQDRNVTLRAYNNDELDALVVNGAASTGLSAHTDPRFKYPNGVKQRIMIIGQPAPDINQFMQMLGRLMRFGQLKAPAYSVLQSSLAAETRFMTMLRKKMASLNANTTADTESEMTQRQGFAEDIFNSVGDDVVYRVLEANPDLAKLADIELPDPGEIDDFARKATGRFVLLPNADADRLWRQIEEEFNATIKTLDDMGENPLKATVEDLRARTLQTSTLVEGTGGTTFDSPAMLEKVEVKPPNKPPTFAEAIDKANENRSAMRQEVRDWLAKSAEAEQARLATAEARGATPEQLDRIRISYRATREAVNTALLRLGQAYGIDPSGSGEPQFYGVPVALKLHGQQASDFSSPSRQNIVIAINTAKRSLTLPLSKTEGGEAAVLTDIEGDPETTFNDTAETMTERFIVTGNILRGYETALGAATKTKPRVTIYSKADGVTEIGVLMPPGFKPRDIAGAGKLIKDAKAFHDALIMGKTITAGNIEITPDYRISVPANSRYKTVWGHPDFRGLLVNSYARQIGLNLIGQLAPDRVRGMFDILQAAGLQIAEVGHGSSVGPGAAASVEFTQRQRTPPPNTPTPTAPAGAPITPQVVRKATDLGFSRFFHSPQYIFRFTQLGKLAQNIWERMATAEQAIRTGAGRDIQFIVEDVISHLPRELRKKGGQAFYELLDGRPMSEIEAQFEGEPGGEKVIAMAERVKTRLEDIRVTIRETKREEYTRYIMGQPKSAVFQMYTTTIDANAEYDMITKADMAYALSRTEFPDDWGIADGTYLPHIFFGKWRVTAQVQGEPEPRFVTRVDTPGLGKAHIAQAVQADPALANAQFSIAPDMVLPTDMVRLAGGRFWRLVNDMAEQFEVGKAEITQAIRGNIGRQASKQKWFGNLRERLGAAGYSKEYKRVMSAYLLGFHRWLHLSRLNREVVPDIEQLKNSRPNAAKELTSLLEYLWGQPATSTLNLDASLQRFNDRILVPYVPFLADRIKPLLLDRWTRGLRTAIAMAHLTTVRFMGLVNRLQPFQTLLPLAKEGLFWRAKVLQHTEAGRELLDRYGVTFDIGQYGEAATKTKLAALRERLSGERSNQELAFLAGYIHYTDLGYGPDEAARLAFLNFQLRTQFTPLMVDTPPWLRGPVVATIFQYKRFTLKTLDLGASMLKEKEFGGLARMLLAYLVFGGLGFYLKALFMDDDTAKQVKREMNEHLGKNGADLVYYGLPGTLGIDLSGSLSVIDHPRGDENLFGYIGRQAVGPGVSTAVNIFGVLTKEEREALAAIDRIEAGMRKVPALRPMAELIALEQSDTDIRTADGEILYKRTIAEVIKSMGAFRTTGESANQQALNATMELKHRTAGLLNALYLASQKDDVAIEKAYQEIERFNAAWPDMAITPLRIKTYIANRFNRQGQTELERQAGKRAEAFAE